MSARFTEAYGCKYPFVQAGMAFAAMTPDLPIAVCRAGGVGGIGVGFTPPDVLRQFIQAIKGVTDGPYHISFLSYFDNDAQIRVAAEEQVPVASFHWGHPSNEHIQLLKDAGVKIWEQVGTVEDAIRAVGDGVDAVVAQGTEAGGHNYGTMPTMAFVPAVADAIGDAMLLAAGGIADGRAVAAALALGADAVWVGTAMVATEEAFVHGEHKKRLVEAKGEDTVLTSIFGRNWPDFNPMRVLRNGVVNEYHDRLDEVPADNSDLPVIGTMPMGDQTLELRKFATIVPVPGTEGDWEELPWLAGEGVGMVKDIRPAGVVVEEMMTEAQAIIKNLGQ